VVYWNPACALDVSAWMNYYESRRYSRPAREVLLVFSEGDLGLDFVRRRYARPIRLLAALLAAHLTSRHPG
jgi:hypothetical protein